MSNGVWMDSSLMGAPHTHYEVPDLTEGFFTDAARIIARYPLKRSALLPLLYLIQSEHGFVSSQGMRAVADLLGLTRAEVGAVATFYTMFKRDPQGAWLVSVCTQPSCTLAGGDAIKKGLEASLGITCGQTTEDGSVSLEEVECLCACDGAPVVSVNYENYQRMNAEQIVEMVEALRAGGAPPTSGQGSVPLDFKAVNRRMSGLEQLS